MHRCFELAPKHRPFRVRFPAYSVEATSESTTASDSSKPDDW